jgi:hypothetical protein
MDDVSSLVPSIRNFIDDGDEGADKGTDAAFYTEVV